jgi:hypothetical protein
MKQHKMKKKEICKRIEMRKQTNSHVQEANLPLKSNPEKKENR